MAVIYTCCWVTCMVLVHYACLGSSDSDPDHRIADGSQPELFIFHESCALKKDEGDCKGLIERFYFDIDTGLCKVFQFGGCKGNANNFESSEACQEMCLVSADKSPCHLEEAPGPCRGLVSRYFFDNQSKECKHFYYGGCFGNANNFRNMRECRARCQNPEVGTVTDKVDEAPTLFEAPKLVYAFKEPTIQFSVQPLDESDFTPPPVCLSGIDRGTPCEGEGRSERRYVYNPRTKRCHGLPYSGCGGNRNNFVLKRHCIKMCMKPGYPEKRIPIRIKKKNIDILFQSV
ncbi:hypothetical protein DPEC_G00138500 [Dallia pectoralis]|uniref:Uncharacterized protein n=1 Tax=Dallia pectoralis TaxID=75939 RepID=A0ACC2GM73_DALPE|nr:hypothetical protein DPEC_G00138500 [Dallia pectoralis]